MKKKVLVVGLGRFGASIVSSLWSAGAETLVVDADPAAVDAVKRHASAAFVGDATAPGVLEGIGAADADIAVVTFGEAFEASVLCVAELRRIGVKEIMVRAESGARAEVLRAVGASRVLHLEEEMGRRVATDLVTPIAADLLEFAHGHHVHPWTATGSLVGKTLAEAELRKRFGVTVLGYHRPSAATSGKRKFDVGTADYRIVAGDVLLLVGETGAIQKFVSDVGV